HGLGDLRGRRWRPTRHPRRARAPATAPLRTAAGRDHLSRARLRMVAQQARGYGGGGPARWLSRRDLGIAGWLRSGVRAAIGSCGTHDLAIYETSSWSYQKYENRELGLTMNTGDVEFDRGFDVHGNEPEVALR